MKLTLVVLLCACACLAVGDVAHVKAAKAKLIRGLARAKHHKRGVLTSVPSFKLGYDIPVVTHSVVKPLVVSYPPAAAVTAVKVPLAHPFHRYPVPVGHRVPVPHPHYGLKFPHGPKNVIVPKPDHHFHHHHHHVEPKPVVPVVPAPVPVPATPVIPLGQPTATVHAHPVPAPSPPVILQPAPIPAPAPAPLFPAPSFNILSQEHLHVKPVLPAAPLHLAQAPLLPYASQFPYVLRPGNAVQSSFFATYPRYPLLNSYQAPLYPLAQAAPATSVSQVIYERPQVHPHLHLVPQAVGQEGVVIEQAGAAEVPHHHLHLQPTQPTVHLQPQPAVHLQPDVHLHHDVHLQPALHGVHVHQDGHLQPDVHLHSAQPEVHLHTAQPGLVPTQATVQVQPTQPGIHQVPVEHDGWSPVPAQPHDLAPAQPTPHFGQEANFGIGQEVHFGQDAHHQFAQDHGTQGYENHAGDSQYHDYQNQLQHHIQQQIDQAQYEQHINNLNNQHNIGQEYAPNQDFANQGQNFNQQGFNQQGYDYSQHAQQFGQQDFNQNTQGFSQQDFQGQNFAQSFGQQDFNQHGQDFNNQGHDFSQQQPAGEYGVPQGAEGRSSEADEENLYHNHIPLKLQPPLERPLEHFR